VCVSNTPKRVSSISSSIVIHLLLLRLFVFKGNERERHSLAAGLAVRANNFVRLSHEGPRSRTVGSREEEVAPPVVCVCVCGDSLAMT
jgi:hypothetical protein